MTNAHHLYICELPLNQIPMRVAYSRMTLKRKVEFIFDRGLAIASLRCDKRNSTIKRMGYHLEQKMWQIIDWLKKKKNKGD